MAIIIEQEKKSVNWFGIITAIVIIGVLFAGAYFVLFTKPELIEIVVPGKVSDLSQLSQLSFNPEELLNSPQFKVLKQFDTDVAIPQPGRSNPFQPY